MVARDGPRCARPRRPSSGTAGGCCAGRLRHQRRAAVRAMAAAVVDGLGGADILVNAAARVPAGAVVGIDGFEPADICRRGRVKVLGYLRCVRAVVPLMRGNGWGRIINVSGLAARSTGAITGTRAQRRGGGADQEPGRRARAARHQRDRGPPGLHADREDVGGMAGRAARAADSVSARWSGRSARTSPSAASSPPTRSPRWWRSSPRRRAWRSTATPSQWAAARSARSTTNNSQRREFLVASDDEKLPTLGNFATRGESWLDCCRTG